MAKLNEILGEVYDQIPEEIKKKYKDIELVDGSNYVEKAEIDNANNSIKEYKKQLKDRDNQLNDLKEKVKDSEELTHEIEKLKYNNEESTKQYENQLKQIAFENKLEKKLGEFKPKNLKILKKALDLQKISLDGDNFLGLEDQIMALKESDAFLFEEEKSGGTGMLGGGQSYFNNLNNSNVKSLGEKLAEEKSEATKASEILNNFFN